MKTFPLTVLDIDIESFVGTSLAYIHHRSSLSSEQISALSSSGQHGLWMNVQEQRYSNLLDF
jgi:hypothetical protein